MTPSILFLPRLDSWWDVTPETFQMTFLSCLSSLPPSTPLLVLATAECPWQQLPERLRSVFMDTGSRFFTVRGPSLNQRKKFFYKVLLEKPFQPPPPKPLPLSGMPVFSVILLRWCCSIAVFSSREVPQIWLISLFTCYINCWPLTG